MTFAEPQNMTGLIDIFEYSNSVSDNIFGIGAIISFYLIVMMYLNFNRQQDFAESMVVSGFLTTIFSILFLLMGLITDWHLFVIITFFVVSTVWLYVKRNG